MKVLISLCFLAVARAGVIQTDYAPASAVYSSINSPVTYTKSFGPAPGYQSFSSTHETRTNNLDGSQLNTFSKTLNTPYSSVNKFDSRTSNDGFVSHSVPVYSNAQVLHPQTTYSVATPIVHHVSSPVSYTGHNTPFLTKTLSAPPITSYSTPVVTKTISPIAYTSHTPVVAQPAVKITYSEAPAVSHMTFTGLGTSYSW